MADSGSYTDATIESRRRLAEAMMKQGMDTSPIQHHYQGLARLANALFGGMSLNRLDEQSRERDKDYADTLLKTLDGAAAGTSSPAPSQSKFTTTVTAGEGSEAKVIPASVRTNNPGAQWPGPSATKFGSTRSETLKDGNKIAVFDNPEDGGAAQFDLLNRRYVGKSLQDAIAEWSGGNNVPTYVGAISQATGINPNEPITSELLRSPKGIQLVKAMSQHEAGQPGALDDASWARAQAKAFGNAPNSTAQADPAQTQQVTGSAQTGATGVPTGSGTQNGINPQVRARVEALIRSPDKRARAMGEKLVATLVSQGVKPTELGLTPVYGTDKDGNTVIMQMSPTGQMTQSKMPEGVKASSGIEKLDAGTHWIIKDKKTGQTIGTEAKDIVGKESAEERGKELGKAQVDLPRVLNNAKSTLKYIDAVLKDPNLGNVTGWQNWIPHNKDIPWNADTVARVDQLKGKAFLEAFNSLKGAGQITEVEGAKATDALARLTNMNQTDEGYKQALEDFKTEVNALVEVARQKAGQGSKAQGTATQTPGAPRVREYNPATGKIE